MPEQPVSDNTNAAPSAQASTPVPAPAPLPRMAYSLRETAEILGLSYISVYRLVQRGLLRSSNALRHKLIPLSEIERFLQSTL